MKPINQDIKNKALKLCDDLEKETHLKSVFTNVSVEEFLSSLRKLIQSEGEVIYQSKNTCGIAAVLHLVSKLDLIQLVKFSISLYKHGVGKFNDYEIKPEDNVKVWTKMAKPTGNFSGVSLVLIGAIRFKENTSLRFELGTMDGMTWPSEVKNILNLMAGSKVTSAFWGSWAIKRFQTKLKQDAGIILLYRTISWKEKKQLFTDPWHYIVLKNIKFSDDNLVEVNYWGYGSIKRIKLTKFQFYRGIVKTFVLSPI